jgi:hypothetical protein
MGYADLTHEELAVLVPELMLSGHMIDRSGMPFLIEPFGHDGQTQIAIEEWMGASPCAAMACQRPLPQAGGCRSGG